jgi:hypothetical protein
MAQTGFTPIQLYSSSTPTNAPSAGNLTNDTKGSELAINIADKNLFFKDSTNAVNTVPIRQSSTSSNGWLSSTDWNTFNSKQPALVSGVNIKTVNGTTLLGSGDLGTITTAYGGTGLSSYTAGDLSYYASGTALTKLAIGAANRVLTSTGSAPQWSTSLALTDLTATGTLGVGTTSLLGGAKSEIRQNADANYSTTFTTGTTKTQLVLRDLSDVGTYATPFSTLAFAAGNTGAAWSTISNVRTTAQTSALTFSTSNGSSNPVERARIHASGGVSIGNTSDPGAGGLTVNGAAAIGSGLAIGNALFFSATFAIGGSVLSSGAGTHFLKWNNSTGTVTYDTSSRLVKTNIEDSPYGLAEILKLKPRKYFRTDDQCIEHGLIADEVVEIMPEYVPMVPKSLLTKDDNDTELVPGGVNYERIVAPLINAIHELNAQIDALKLQIGK